MLDFYKGKKVFITGHTGFKGSWLCKLLANAGADVTGYSLNPPTSPSLFEIANIESDVKSVIGDIRDFDSLKKAFDEAQPEIVLHLAAQPIVRDSYKMPAYTYETNVMGTVNILECVRQSSCVKSFLNVTTDKVYENREWQWGYRENEPLDGFDPYSNSKKLLGTCNPQLQKFFLCRRKNGDFYSESRKCYRRRRFCKRQNYSRLRESLGKGRGYYRPQSAFHKTVSACSRTALCISYDCKSPVRGH